MTCFEQFLLSRARHGVLHILYILLFPLLSFQTAKHVLQMATMYSKLRRIKNN